MSAIPAGPAPWSTEDRAFQRWLVGRGELLMAKQLRALQQYHVRFHLMERIGITEERHAYYLKLRSEFSEPRQKMRTHAYKLQKDREAATASKNEPEAELRKRIFPKRHVRKGIAG